MSFKMLSQFILNLLNFIWQAFQTNQIAVIFQSKKCLHLLQSQFSSHFFFHSHIHGISHQLPLD